MRTGDVSFPEVLVVTIHAGLGVKLQVVVSDVMLRAFEELSAAAKVVSEVQDVSEVTVPTR